MNSVFIFVARLLEGIARITGFTYNEINIIAYYIILPFIYVALLDRIVAKHILKIIYICAWTLGLLLIDDFSVFSDALFQWSVDFLLLFSVIGLNYVAASVVICVILPGLALLLLSMYAFPAIKDLIHFQRKRVEKCSKSPDPR